MLADHSCERVVSVLACVFDRPRCSYPGRQAASHICGVSESEAASSSGVVGTDDDGCGACLGRGRREIDLGGTGTDVHSVGILVAAGVVHIHLQISSRGRYMGGGNSQRHMLVDHSLERVADAIRCRNDTVDQQAGQETRDNVALVLTRKMLEYAGPALVAMLFQL